MDQVIHVLLVLAAVCYLVGGLSRFLKFQLLGHEPTVWWRGAVGLLGFSIVLILWEILQVLRTRG